MRHDAAPKLLQNERACKQLTHYPSGISGATACPCQTAKTGLVQPLHSTWHLYERQFSRGTLKVDNANEGTVWRTQTLNGRSTEKPSNRCIKSVGDGVYSPCYFSLKCPLRQLIQAGRPYGQFQLVMMMFSYFTHLFLLTFFLAHVYIQKQNSSFSISYVSNKEMR